MLHRELNIKKTKRNYDNIAWFYNLWSSWTESKAAQKVLELADIEDDQHILEVACGTGKVFQKIVQKNPNGINIGIDLSPSMLAKAKKLLKTENTSSYELLEKNIFDLKIVHHFDVIFNNFMLDLMPADQFDPILTTFHNLLKPDGIAVISTFSYGTKKVHKFWRFVAKYAPELLTGCRPVDIRKNILHTGFVIEKELEINQNTFPSKVYRARRK